MYMTNTKENITILFSRKRKIISGKFIFFSYSKFWKSEHELVQIEKKNPQRINITFSLGEPEQAMCFVWQFSFLHFTTKSSYLKTSSLQQHEKMWNNLSRYSSILFTFGKKKKKHVSNRCHSLQKYEIMYIKEGFLFLFVFRMIKFAS